MSRPKKKTSDQLKCSLKPWPSPKPVESISFDDWKRLHYWSYSEKYKCKVSLLSREFQYGLYIDHLRYCKSEEDRYEDIKSIDNKGWKLESLTEKENVFLIKHFCGHKRFIELRAIYSFKSHIPVRCEDCWSLGRKTPRQMEARKKFIRYYHAVVKDGLIIEKKLKEDESKKHNS